MQDAETINFLNGLRGVQPMIFLAYMLVRQAMTVKELQVCTGLSDDAIRPALESLAAKGFLFKQTGEHGRTIWLPRGDTFFGRAFQNPLPADSGALSSSSSTSGSVITSYLPLEEEEAPESAPSGLCLAALDAAGIREPKRSRLAKLEHVTVDLIKAHVERAKREGLPLGTAIHRIEYNWTVDLNIVKKDKNPFGHDHDCRCGRCRDARNNVAFGTHCPDCWGGLESECRCSESEEA